MKYATQIRASIMLTMGIVAFLVTVSILFAPHAAFAKPDGSRYVANRALPSVPFGLTQISIEDAQVTAEQQTYNSKAQTPAPIVTLNGKTLEHGVDYDSVTYSNNIDAGNGEISVTGIGDYTGTARGTFVINPLQITGFQFQPNNAVYTGQPATPQAVVTARLFDVPNDSYTLTWDTEDLTNVGRKMATVEAFGNYSGSSRAPFTITPASIEGARVSVEDQVYDGTSQEPPVAVTVDGRELEADKDFTVEYGENVNAGLGTFTVKGQGNYTDELTGSFTISPAEIANATVKPLAMQAYTGDPITPVPEVVFQGADLEAGTDFTLAYNHNIEVGTAEITISGTGNFSGTTTATFEIVDKTDIAQATAEEITGCVYNAAPHEPVPELSYNGQALVEGVDFEVIRYQDNVDAGTAKVTVLGIGDNFIGEKTIEFEIDLASLNDATINPIPDQMYTGAAITPNVVVKLDGRTLQSEVDYTVSYKDNVGVGTATVTVTGRDNYKDSAKTTFKVTASIAGATVTNIVARTYNTKAQTQSPKVVLDGKTLKAGTDYTLSYKNNVNAGTATMTVTGKGVYTGSKAATFKINPAKVSAAQITYEAEKRWTGKALVQTPQLRLAGNTVAAGNYTLTYKNNVNTGTATMTITGKGNLTGSVNKNYKIIKTANWERLYGAGAMETMQTIAAKFGTSPTAVIATNASFKDMLAASALAGSTNAAMLVTPKASLAAQTKKELERMGVTTVYLVGSTADLSANVEKQVKALAKVKTVKRISAANASAKAIECAKATAGRSDTVIITTQNTFKDALSISPYAYATKSPVLYTETNKKLSAATVNYIKSAGFKKAIIVGGPVAVLTDVDAQLKSAGITAANITRLAGSNQYRTSKIIAEWEQGRLKNGTGGSGYYQYAYVKFQPSLKMNANYLGVARADRNDYGWKDALAGAALCGRNRSIILLADKANSVEAENAVKAFKGNIAHAYVFGGPAAVPASVMTKLQNASKDTAVASGKSTAPAAPGAQSLRL